ncbi:hypothetical protein ACHAWF_007810 [Thalassiosira exigua]
MAARARRDPSPSSSSPSTPSSRKDRWALLTNRKRSPRGGESGSGRGSSRWSSPRKRLGDDDGSKAGAGAGEDDNGKSKKKRRLNVQRALAAACAASFAVACLALHRSPGIGTGGGGDAVTSSPERLSRGRTAGRRGASGREPGREAGRGGRDAAPRPVKGAERGGLERGLERGRANVPKQRLRGGERGAEKKRRAQKKRDRRKKKRDRRRRKPQVRDAAVGGYGKKGDVGPCSHPYPDREEPSEGWTEAVDFYHRRESHDDRDAAYVACLSELDPSEVYDEMLVDAARMGLTEAATVLREKFELDPLKVPSPATEEEGERVPEAGGLFNALQEAILGGYAEMIPVLAGGDYDVVIDGYGRTVRDYVRARGSPIRPSQAKDVLRMDDVEDEGRQQQQRRDSQKEAKRPKFESGWDERSSSKYDTICDIDEIYDDSYMTREVFWKEYYSMGRPFVLRNHVHVEGLKPFAKSFPYWDPDGEKLNVGPTAYPSVTDQSYCREGMTASEIEQGKRCPEMPDKRMVHAWHPTDEDFDELYAAKNGNVFSKPYGWREISEWFGEAQDARPTLDEDMIVRCTQYPGDVIFFPNHWGHLTINHGFTIGAAVILDDDYQRYGLRDAAGGDEAREAVAPRALAFGSGAAKAEHASKSRASHLPFLFVHIPKTGGKWSVASFCSWPISYVLSRRPV